MYLLHPLRRELLFFLVMSGHTSSTAKACERREVKMVLSLQFFCKLSFFSLSTHMGVRG